MRCSAPEQIPLPLPTAFAGSFIFGDAAIEKYRVLAVLVGLAVFIARCWCSTAPRSAS